jgi:hypothetical protein
LCRILMEEVVALVKTNDQISILRKTNMLMQ